MNPTPHIPLRQRPDVVQLELLAMNIRHNIMKIVTKAKSSHMGCSFSLTDILTVLYHYEVSIDLIKKKDPNRDMVILSKGHAASALYATLASAEIIKKELLYDYYTNGSLLCGHPMRGLPGVESSTGSLGHGLPLAVGVAYAAQIDKSPRRCYVVVGDGECQEGSIWEAAFTAARYKLNSLTLIVDYNNLQGLDITQDVMPGELDDKFRSFGWNTTTINGHDMTELMDALDAARASKLPSAIIARTCKGQGVSFIESKIAWHYKSFSPEEFNQAEKELLGT